MIDANSLMVGISTNRQRGYVELGERVLAAFDSSDGRDRDIIALAKLMEAYARKYKMEFVEKQDNDSWLNHLQNLITGSQFLGHELDAEEAAKEALEQLEEYEETGKPFGYAHLTPAEKNRYTKI
jgi:hypothetical protein